MFRGITPLATTSIVLLLSTHTYGQGSANLITAPEFVAPVKLIDRTAQIRTKLAYGFSGEGERFRLHIVLEGDLTEARNQLTKDLARTWRQTDCKGDDLKTDNVSISPTGDALRARFDFRFVRWWSVSN